MKLEQIVKQTEKLAPDFPCPRFPSATKKMVSLMIRLEMEMERERASYPFALQNKILLEWFWLGEEEELGKLGQIKPNFSIATAEMKPDESIEKECNPIETM